MSQLTRRQGGRRVSVAETEGSSPQTSLKTQWKKRGSMFGKSGVSLGGKSPSDAAGKAQDLMGQPTFAHDDYLSLLLIKCGEDLSEIKNDVMHSADLLAKQSKVAERAAHVVMRSFSTAVKVYRERVERENEEKERIKRVIYAEAVKPWQNVALDCAAPLSPQQKQTGQERVGAVSGAGAGAGAGAGGRHLSPPATPPSNARVLGTLSPVSGEHTPKATSLSSPLKEKLGGAGGRPPSSIVLTCSEGKVQALQELLLMRRGSYHGQVSHEVATVHRITNSPTASKMNGSLHNLIRRNSLHDVGESKTMENLNVADASGKTPLQMALDRQSWGCLRVLLKEDDVDVEMQDAYGNTPIHTYLSSRGAQRAPDILDLFIETRQVDLGIRNAKGQTPLMCCAGNRFIDAVGEEAEGKFDRVPTGEREDRNSSTSGGPASPSPVPGSKSGPGGPSGGVVPGGKPKPAKPFPSVPATPSGMSMLSRLIKMGADVCDEDDDGKTAIDYAAASACINELKMLATNPECVPNHLTSALFSTMGEGAECDIRVIKYLLDEVGADPVEGQGKMNNVLIAACRMNRVSCLEYLLKIPSIKKLVFERNALGLTALHEAVAKKSNDCAKILLDIIREESTFGVVTRNRRSAPGLKHVVKRIAASPPDDPMLMILDDKLVVAAAESCNLEVLPLIVNLNPYLANCHFNYYDASAQERVETSLLCWSIKMCDTELVKKLVDECAIITDADPGSGLTPLMQAIECLSEGHFAKLALATLQRGVDHIYLELDQVAEVTCMTKPQVVQIADALRDGSGNSLRSKAGKLLYSRSPWMCSWEGLVAISCATDPDLGKILREYTAELDKRKNIYAQISKIFFAYHEDVNVVANGSTALAIAAHRCHWKVFEELVAMGADRQHPSVIKACAASNNQKELKKCLEIESERPSLSTALVEEIFESTCSVGHTASACLLMDHGQERGLVNRDSGVVEKELLIAAQRMQYWMIEALLDMGVKQSVLPQALIVSAEKGDYRSVEKLLEAGTDPNGVVDLSGCSPLSIAADRWCKTKSVDHFQSIVMLLSQGADPKSQDRSKSTVLMIAARAGNTVLVQNVIKMSICFFGKDATRELLDMQDAEGMTSLMHAVKSFSTGTVLKLLSGEADPDILSYGDGVSSPPPMTALAILTSLCQRSAPDFLVALVSKTTNLRVTDENGNSFIMWAAKFDQQEAVEAAMRHGTATNLGLDDFDESVQSPLEIAVMCRHHAIALMLVELWDKRRPVTDMTKEGRYVGISILMRAIEYGWQDVAQSVIENTCNLDTESEVIKEALFSCTEKRWFFCVVALLAKGISPNAYSYRGESAIMCAVRRNETLLVQSLLSYGAKDKEAACVVAIFLGHGECFRTLWETLEYTADIVRTCACVAAITNRYDMLMSILEQERPEMNLHTYGVKVRHVMTGWCNLSVIHLCVPTLFSTLQNEDPSVPLLSAVSKGNYRCTSLILESDADPQVTDDAGLSAITWASTVGNLDIVKILLKAGASVSLEAGTRTMSFADLRRAYQIKSTEEANRFLVRNFIKMGHNINVTISPLIAALYKGQEDVVRLLVEAGAEVHTELNHWCDQAIIDEPRLEPVLRRMMSIAMLYDDFKAYGPFGFHGYQVNSADVGNIPREGTIHAIIVQFSLLDGSAITALQFVHMVNGQPFPCKIHHTNEAHAGNFDKLNNFSHVERLTLEDNEYVISAELGVGDRFITSIRFTTNYRVCKWLGVDPVKHKYRVVTVAPTGREIVGLFTSVHDKFYTMGFLTRLRMGDFAWRTLRAEADEEEEDESEQGRGEEEEEEE